MLEIPSYDEEEDLFDMLEIPSSNEKEDLLMLFDEPEGLCKCMQFNVTAGVYTLYLCKNIFMHYQKAHKI